MALIFFLLGLISGLVAVVSSTKSDFIADLLLYVDTYEFNMETIKHLEEKRETLENTTKKSLLFLAFFFILFILMII